MNYYLDNTETLNNRQSEIPAVVGFYDPRRRRVFVTCPFCGQEHIHGDESGPRLSHCTDRARAQYEITTIIRPKIKIQRQRWNYNAI